MTARLLSFENILSEKLEGYKEWISNKRNKNSGILSATLLAWPYYIKWDSIYNSGEWHI